MTEPETSQPKDQLETESTGKQRPAAQGTTGQSSFNDSDLMNLSAPDLLAALTNDPRRDEVLAQILQTISSSALLSQAQSASIQQPIKEESRTGSAEPGHRSNGGSADRPSASSPSNEASEAALRLLSAISQNNPTSSAPSRPETPAPEEGEFIPHRPNGADHGDDHDRSAAGNGDVNMADASRDPIKRERVAERIAEIEREREGDPRDDLHDGDNRSVHDNNSNRRNGDYDDRRDNNYVVRERDARDRDDRRRSSVDLQDRRNRDNTSTNERDNRSRRPSRERSFNRDANRDNINLYPPLNADRDRERDRDRDRPFRSNNRTNERDTRGGDRDRERSLVSIVDALQLQYDVAEENLRRLQNEYAIDRREVNSYETKYQDKRADVERLTTQIAELKRQVKDKEFQLEDVVRQKSEFESMWKILGRKLEDKKTPIRDAQNKVDDIGRQIKAQGGRPRQQGVPTSANNRTANFNDDRRDGGRRFNNNNNRNQDRFDNRRNDDRDRRNDNRGNDLRDRDLDRDNRDRGRLTIRERDDHKDRVQLRERKEHENSWSAARDGRRGSLASDRDRDRRRESSLDRRVGDRGVAVKEEPGSSGASTGRRGRSREVVIEERIPMNLERLERLDGYGSRFRARDDQQTSGAGSGSSIAVTERERIVIQERDDRDRLDRSERGRTADREILAHEGSRKRQRTTSPAPNPPSSISIEGRRSPDAYYNNNAYTSGSRSPPAKRVQSAQGGKRSVHERIGPRPGSGDEGGRMSVIERIGPKVGDEQDGGR
ncbi:hypothetical protein HK097_003347, partial [Rhizophlyctis rosea]